MRSSIHWNALIVLQKLLWVENQKEDLKKMRNGQRNCKSYDLPAD